MRINEIILEDQTLDEISALGAGQKVGGFGGKIVQGTKDFFSGVKQGYQQARNPAQPQPGTSPASSGATAAPAQPNTSAPTQATTGPSQQRLSQIAQNQLANIGDRDEGELRDSLKHLQSLGHGDEHPVVKVYKDELAKRDAAKSTASLTAPAATSQTTPAAAPKTAPATINAPAVAPNIEAIKKAYTNLDTSERDKLKSELEVIDDQERLASGTNESLDDILKLAKLK